MTVILDLQSRTKMFVHFHKLIFHSSVIYHKTPRAKLNVKDCIILLGLSFQHTYSSRILSRERQKFRYLTDPCKKKFALTIKMFTKFLLFINFLGRISSNKDFENYEVTVVHYSDM